MLLSGPASKAYVINLHSRNTPVLYTAYHSVHSHNYMTPVVQYVQWSTETFTRQPCALPKFEGLVGVLICMTVVYMHMIDWVSVIS